MTFMSSGNRVLRLSEVQARCGLSRSSLYRKMRNESFPEGLKVGVRAVRWPEDEITGWLASPGLGRPVTHPTEPFGNGLPAQRNPVKCKVR